MNGIPPFIDVNRPHRLHDCVVPDDAVKRHGLYGVMSESVDDDNLLYVSAFRFNHNFPEIT